MSGSSFFVPSRASWLFFDIISLKINKLPLTQGIFPVYYIYVQKNNGKSVTTQYINVRKKNYEKLPPWRGEARLHPY